MGQPASHISELLCSSRAIFLKLLYYDVVPSSNFDEYDQMIFYDSDIESDITLESSSQSSAATELMPNMKLLRYSADHNVNKEDALAEIAMKLAGKRED